ncbi:MAG: aminopeptidase P N-terminal domain-containing protein, partial [Bifidobacteriaceae bacterium]|nr:aminopeptidase P N-terminal domain-containing protein [Bifidobacteriaceae bacterium]
MSDQPLSQRNDNRSHRPTSPAFRAFMSEGWAASDFATPSRSAAADFAAERRERLAARFPGERLIVPAGIPRVRSNDTDFRFRPHSAFAHLTGLGTDREPEAVLVLEPVDDGGHEPVLYIRPAAGKDTSEFYADSRYGEFWVGRRPTLSEIATTTGIRTEHVDGLRDALAKDAGPGAVSLRVIRAADEAVTEMVDEIRTQAGLPPSSALPGDDLGPDGALEEAASEARLVKDDYEISEMRLAVAASIRGFERVVRALPRAVGAERGERVVESAFELDARV